MRLCMIRNCKGMAFKGFRKCFNCLQGKPIDSDEEE